MRLSCCVVFVSPRHRWWMAHRWQSCSLLPRSGTRCNLDVCPSVRPSLLLSPVASHSATLYKAATPLQRFVFFFLGRMHMDEMKATRDGKNRLPPLNWSVNMTKKVFFLLLFDSAFKLFWQQLQKLESCCRAAPVGGLCSRCFDLGAPTS